jgi:hypothetical protein
MDIKAEAERCGVSCKQYRSCIRKRPIDNKKAARDHAAALTKLHRGKKLEAYKCRYCQFWHVGGIGDAQ